MDYRSAEALLASAQELRAALALHAVPDHSTRWWFSRHQVKPRLLARVLTETAELFQRAASPRSRTVAVDSTGCARTQASPYYQLRATASRYTPPRPHVAEMVGRSLDRPSGAVWAGGRSRAARGPCGVSPPSRTNPGPAALYPSAGRWRREDLGIESIMPPVAGRPARGLTRHRYRRQLQLTFPRQAYGQRWKVETLISVVKRRLGGAVTARRSWQQVKQTLRRGVTDHLYRAVQLGWSHRLFKAAA